MGDEMLVCEVCGEVLEGSENSYSVNYAGYYTHVCVACYEGESGLTLCKGCGEDADYCLISEETYRVDTKTGKPVDTGLS